MQSQAVLYQARLLREQAKALIFKARVTTAAARAAIRKTRRICFKHPIGRRSNRKLQNLYAAVNTERLSNLSPRQKLQQAVFLEKIEHPFPKQ